MSRKKLIAANWKLNPSSREEAIDLIENIKIGLKNIDVEENINLTFCLPFIYLELIKNSLKDTRLKIGAQNCYFEEKGAFTGEISALMLKNLGIDYVILGHSERRSLFNESSEIINKKISVALKNNLLPILCVGETLKEKEMGITEEIILSQLEESLAYINCNGENVIIAYEPVWAIGTGKTCSSEDANTICKLIRSKLADLYNSSIAEKTLILYGGSVKSSTIKEQMKQTDIDGALVGGASLIADEFVQLVNNC